MTRSSVVLALALAALTAAPVMAQTAAVTNAIMLQRAGTLDKARVEIDKAITDEKTSTKAKTWYTRGEIYEQMIGHQIYGKTAPANAAQIAYESYQKAIQYDEKGKEYAPQAKEKMKNLYGAAFNAGVTAFNDANKALKENDAATANQKFDAAIKSYELAANINPQDTAVSLYAAYAYEGKKDLAGAESAYRKALATPISAKTKTDIYGTLMRLNREKPDAEQIAIAREALAAYPTNKDFMLQEISLMLKMGQEKEAIDKIQNAIKVDPKNSNLYAVLGSLYDKTGKPDQAVTVYQQAIDADPTNFDAQFNLGVYQFNRGAELRNKYNKLSLAESKKPTAAKMDTDAKMYFTKSIPYFEAALKLKDCDKATLTSLQKAYVALNKLPDAERVDKQAQGCATKK
jgi:tetratricopeptide (TPR) repeat protein